MNQWRDWIHGEFTKFLNVELEIGIPFTERSSFEELGFNAESEKKMIQFVLRTFNVSIVMETLAAPPKNLSDFYDQLLEELNVLPRPSKNPVYIAGNGIFTPERRVDISEILPGHLFLSGKEGAYSLEALKLRNIKYIINCALEISNAFADEFTYLKIRANDVPTEPIYKYFPDAVKCIEKAKTENCGVLVHCMAGMSRSATVVIAYLMTSENMNLKTAFLHARAKRPIVGPNPGFFGQLMSLELFLYSTQSMNQDEYMALG